VRIFYNLVLFFFESFSQIDPWQKEFRKWTLSLTSLVLAPSSWARGNGLPGGSAPDWRRARKYLSDPRLFLFLAQAAPARAVAAALARSTAAPARARATAPRPHRARRATPTPRRHCCSGGRARALAAPRRRCCSLARTRTAPPCPRAVARGWLQRRAATPSTAVLALASPWSPPAASTSPRLAPLHRRPRPALQPSTASVPPAPVELDSPRATSIVGRATVGPDLRLDLSPSSVDPKR